MKTENLLRKAMKVRKKAYAPYSGFKVGASILSNKGKIYTGANIENRVNGLSVCAEQVALFKGITEGEKYFEKLAVVAKGKIPYPCGACRQILHEHAPQIEIIVSDHEGNYEEMPLKKLLPFPFDI